MRRVARILLCCLTIVLAPCAGAADDLSARVDTLFATWDRTDTPGAALVVLRDGQLVHSRGYGMANLEHGVRNTPSTIFHVASLSKQFTAAAIHLLALDGKLSLDDEVRRHVPELQLQGAQGAQGAPITIRHLLHHTSGLRDQWSLLTLAGLRLDDVITEGDILGLLWQQRALNFAPGDDELYSNSGYTLLGLIVKRVSGQSLDAFVRVRIFGPLGMNASHFQENYGTIVKGRAASYQRTRDGWRYVALSYSNVGATSLQTSAEDLARWVRNFDDPKVGGAPLLAAMLARGRLNDGREIGYASGLALGRYRGLNIVEHSGSDAGYRAHLLRFADARLTVLLLGNASDLNAGELARRVADVYLEGVAGFDASSRAFPQELELSARALEPYLGDFEMRPGFVLRFSADGSRLMVQATGQPRFAMFASAPDRFFTKAFESSVAFDAPAADGLAAAATWRQNGRDLPLRRIVRETTSAEALQACAGEYYSDELRTLYRLTLRDGKPMLRYPRGELALEPVSRDVFSAAYPIGSVSLRRGATGACEGLAISTGRVRNLEFRRVTLLPASPSGEIRRAGDLPGPGAH
jgi:CubicO group peptidase (beta-lactamase class C family)